MKKKIFLIPLAMFMTAGAIGMAGCDNKKPDPDPTPQTQTLESIDVTKQPTKLVYQVGDTFDPAGLEVQAKYSDGSTKVLAGTEYTISPLTALTEDSKVITIEYTEGGVTRYAEIDITVTSGEIIAVTGLKYTLTPNKYTIEIGETINIKVDVEPAEATVKSVTYEFDSSIVSIENGVITGLAEGTTDIIIKSASNPEISKKISGFKVKKADAAVPAATAAGFELFTEGALKNGETINIAAIYEDKILGMGVLAGTFITPTELSVDGDGKLVVGEALNYKALLNNDGTYSLKDSNGKYLSLAASGNNIAIKEVADDDCKFVIGHGENGTTTIVGANTSKDSRFLVYNANNPRFSFYKESTASGYPQLIVYHDGQEAEQKAVTGVAFKAESYTVEAGFTVSVAAGVLPEDATDQEITYSLENVSPAGCATISGNVITGVEAGSADVVATSHDGGFTATVKLTVIPEQVPQHEGTEADPFTGADAILIARKLEHKEVTESSYYIKDTVTKTESFDPNYGNYSFWFGDFECYRMWKNSINNKFTSADEIEVGDVVTVVAKITRYNQTLETAEKTGYTVNIEKPAIPATGVTLDKTELSMEVGSIPQQLVATVAPEKASQEVIWSSSDESKAIVVDGLVTAVAATEEETPVIITAKVASDESLTATCAVTVTPKTRTMTGITATGLAKTEYTEGEKLDLTGLVVQAVYDSGDPETITSGYTTNIALDHELELTDTSLVVSYEGFDADAITLTINEVVRETLPYQTTINSSHLFEGWGPDQEVFSSAYPSLKGAGKAVSAKKLFNAQSKVRVIVNGVCNGTEKESLVTVYGLNDAGEAIEGAKQTFVPKKAAASNKSLVDANAIDHTVMLEAEGITGIKVELTEKGHNLILRSIRITEPPVLVSSVSLDNKTMNLEYPGSNGNLVATVLPDNAENKDVEWTVTGSSVTVVDGVVTPIAVGESTVIATAKDGSGKSDSCVVTVSASAKVLTGIEVATDPDKTAYVSGEKFDPTGMVVMANYEGLDPEPITDYTYSDDDLVAGQTSVEISYGGKTATVAITVTAAKGSSVDNPYTIDEVLAASAGLADKEWLPSRVFVEGIVKGYAASSSNKYTLKDADGTEFIVYKSALPAGDRACIGDTVIMEGWVENYGGTIEMTSYNDTIHNDLPTTAAIVSRGTSTISLDSSSSENATVTFEATATNASEYSFTVEAAEGYKITSVKFAGTEVTGKEGIYTVKVMGNSKILVETIEEGAVEPTKATKSITDLYDIACKAAGEDVLGKNVTSIALDDVVTLSTTGKPNCGLFGQSSGKPTDWRLYQNQDGNLIVTAVEGYTISSIKVTYSVSNTGALFNGATQVKSNDVVTVNGQSITLTVGNTGSATNGQVKVTAIEVIYVAAE